MTELLIILSFFLGWCLGLLQGWVIWRRPNLKYDEWTCPDTGRTCTSEDCDRSCENLK